MTKFKTMKATLAMLSLAMVCSAAYSQTKDDSSSLLRYGDITVDNVSARSVEGIAPACIDMTPIDSWDADGSPNNDVLEFDIGDGNAVTGVSWDVGIATVGGSWLSEAVVKFTSNSDLTTGLFLTVGTGEGAPGDMEFSSEGILLLADAMIPDIVPDADGIIRVEWFESFDDAPDAIDAEWRNAADPTVCAGISLVCTDQAACNAAVSGNGGGELPESQPVPVNNFWALGLMALLLAGLGTVVIRRMF